MILMMAGPADGISNGDMDKREEKRMENECFSTDGDELGDKDGTDDDVAVGG